MNAQTERKPLDIFTRALEMPSPAARSGFVAHVGRGADELVEAGENGFLSEFLLSGFGDAEVDDFGDGDAIVESDKVFEEFVP